MRMIGPRAVARDSAAIAYLRRQRYAPIVPVSNPRLDAPIRKPARTMYEKRRERYVTDSIPSRPALRRSTAA